MENSNQMDILKGIIKQHIHKDTVFGKQFKEILSKQGMEYLAGQCIDEPVLSPPSMTLPNLFNTISIAPLFTGQFEIGIEQTLNRTNIKFSLSSTGSGTGVGITMYYLAYTPPATFASSGCTNYTGMEGFYLNYGFVNSNYQLTNVGMVGNGVLYNNTLIPVSSVSIKNTFIEDATNNFVVKNSSGVTIMSFNARTALPGIYKSRCWIAVGVCSIVGGTYGLVIS